MTKKLQKLPHWNRAEIGGNSCKFFVNTPNLCIFFKKMDFRWWQFLIENLFYKNYVQSICLNYWGLGNLCIILFCTVLNWHFRLVMIVRHNWNFSIWQIQIVRSKSLCIYFISYFDVFHNFVVLISPYIKLFNSQLISLLKGPLKAWLVRS